MRYSPQDLQFMRHAIALARRSLGVTWPNPSVGCLIVKEGQILGRGVTASGGRPHAETQALEQAKGRTEGATAYVTLEPCAHYGKTPPCAEALIKAGISRVVIAGDVLDPDPRVAGAGIKMLQEAGVEVTTSICPQDVLDLNLGHYLRLRYQRPLITLKLASSLDGKVATHSGDSKWITGAHARRQVHMLRAQHDAILVGLGTALADDPMLTCRVKGTENRSPVRVIVDTRLQLPLTSKLVQSAKDVPFWLFTSKLNDSHRLEAFRDCGVRVIELEQSSNGMLDLKEVAMRLAEFGITRLFVEGGATIAGSLAQEGLIDYLEWFRAPVLIGADGLSAIKSFSVDEIKQSLNFDLRGSYKVGADSWDRFVRQDVLKLME